MSLAEAASQSLAVLSQLAVRIRAPLGLNTALVTRSQWAKEAMSLPEAVSQSLAPPERAGFPSAHCPARCALSDLLFYLTRKKIPEVFSAKGFALGFWFDR